MANRRGMHYDEHGLISGVVFKGKKYDTTESYRAGALAAQADKSLKANPFNRDKQSFYHWKQGYLNQRAFMRGDGEAQKNRVGVPNDGW